MTRLGLLLSGCAWVSLFPLRAEVERLRELELEDLLSVPIESVSGVSKYEQSIRRAPAGVTVYTAEDIRRQGWRTLSDALRAAPGMHVRNDRFYDYLGNRGFTRPLDYNSRTLVLIDGHRVNDPIYQQGATGTEFLLDPEMIERIEIIQGPGSAVYGSNAFFGAINIVPRRDRSLGRGEVSTTVTSEPGIKTRVAMGDRTVGGVDYTISVTEEFSRGESSIALGPDWRAANPTFTATSARYVDDLHRQLAYGHAAWRGLEAETAFIRRQKEVPPQVYNTDVNRPAVGTDERAYALLRTRREITADDEFTARLAVDYYRYTGNFTPAVTDLRTQHPAATAVALGGEARWLRTLADRHRLAAGVEYQANVRQDLERYDVPSRSKPVLVRESSNHVSPFAQLEWEIIPPLVLSLGGRVDAPSDYDPRFTPRAGLIWEAGPRSTIKLLYGESFRVPNIEERYAGEAGLVPNPALRPEMNRSWELIFGHRPNSVWTLESRLYRVLSSDLITSRLTGANPLIPDESILVNDEDFLTEGWDASIAAHFDCGIELRGSATLQRTTDRSTGVEVADAPGELVKLAVSTPLGRPCARLSLELMHVGSRRDVSGFEVDGYVTANATLRFHPVWRRWDLAFTAYNLADADWSDPKNSGVIATPPPVFAVRATCSF